MMGADTQRKGACSALLLLSFCSLADGFFQAGQLPRQPSADSATNPPTLAGSMKFSLFSTSQDPRHRPARLRSVPPTTKIAMSAGGQDEVDMDAFRALLTDQWDQGQKKVAEDEQEIDGYKFRDMIVEKWGVPYDVQIKRENFMGKPMLFLNVMWKHLGQQSFHLSEQEYLEHLQALSELLIKWDRVAHVKDLVKSAKKRPNAYFGYAVAIPLDLPAELMNEIDIPEAR